MIFGIENWAIAILRADKTMGGAPNKPMVPTAPSVPATNPPRPLRRRIGQPFGDCSDLPFGGLQSGRRQARPQTTCRA